VTTKTPTPEDVSGLLAAARAETARLADHQRRIDDAASRASNAARLQHYRDWHGQGSTQQREARDAAKRKVDELAAAYQLDIGELFAAFVALRVADAECGSVRNHAAALDTLDPLPNNPFSNARQVRPSQCAPLFQPRDGWTWTAWIEGVIDQHAANAAARRADALNSEVAAKVAAATEKAKADAAALPASELDVDTPVPIAEQHREAVAQIDDTSFDPEALRAGGIGAARKRAEAKALQDIASAGN
jgi:hypothetical protein